LKKVLQVVAFWSLIAMPDRAFAADTMRDAVEELSKTVHEHMAGGMVSGDHIITEEEAAALEYPLLPYELRKNTIIVGHLSGFAEWCGLDWKETSFMPLMTSLRKTKLYNDYQLAFAGMLHGTGKQNAIGSKKGQICTPQDKEMIQKQLAPRN
jgi:hypothetical protein